MAYQRTHHLFGSTFCGLEMRQYWADLPVWENFLNAHPEIRGIWEMGTFKCGMSVFLKLQCMAREMRFWTMDRTLPEEMDGPAARAVQLHLSFHLGDFWDKGLAMMHALVGWEDVHPLLLFVDGGNKPKEFAGFVPLLLPGDFVAVHDYTTEFKPEAADPVAHLLERVWWEECEAPPQPCLTRFWKRI